MRVAITGATGFLGRYSYDAGIDLAAIARVSRRVLPQLNGCPASSAIRLQPGRWFRALTP